MEKRGTTGENAGAKVGGAMRETTENTLLVVVEGGDQDNPPGT